MQILVLRPDQVVVGSRIRAVDQAEVEKLAKSFGDVGQLTPIEVGPADAGGKYPLITGAHRLAAAFEAELSSISAILFDGSPEQVRLHEIDENLHRHELTPYDRTAFVAERIAILEGIKGKSKGGRGKTAAKLPGFDFYRQTADLFGLSTRDVRRAVERRRNIDPAVWRSLRGTQWAKRGSALDAIGALSAPDQLRVIERLNRGETKSMASAIKLVCGGLKAGPDYLARAVNAFEKLGTVDRDAFVVHMRKAGALDRLIADLKAG